VRLHSLLCVLVSLCATAPIEASLAASRAISGQVIGADGKGISQAVVFVQEPADGAPGTPPGATMDQINKTFVPGVLPVVVGAKVNFPNRDQIRHHVYSFSRAKRFELPLYKGEEAKPVLFDMPGVVKIGCNIHDWMSAIIVVLPSTHYAVTDETGRFSIDGLDAGSYTLTAWHAQSKEKTEGIAQRVEVAADVPELTFKLTLAPVRARPATRGARWDE
jgi:plastocyanin